jgi:hypothetical protein
MESEYIKFYVKNIEHGIYFTPKEQHLDDPDNTYVSICIGPINTYISFKIIDNKIIPAYPEDADMLPKYVINYINKLIKLMIFI